MTEASSLILDDLQPVRRPPSYRGMRNFIGRCAVPSRYGTSAAWFESLNELSHMRDLLLTEPVAALVSQFVLVVWHLPGGTRYHYPDLLVRRERGRPLLCEVSRQERVIVPAALAQFALMSATAAAAGWDFELRTELPAQLVRTQAYIHACRFPVQLPPDLDDRLISLSWPTPLRDVAAALDRRPPSGMTGMAAALHLIATARLFTDYDSVLGHDSAIFRSPVADSRAWVVNL